MTEAKEIELGREFRFAVHVPAQSSADSDYHIVKETIHISKGGVIEYRPSMRVFKDFKRPIYVTRPGLRTYKEKREFEHVDRLQRIDTTQSNLKQSLARALDIRNVNSRTSLRDLSVSPYVYGADIPTSLFIKKEAYEKKYKDIAVTPRTVAVLDLEINVLGEYNGLKKDEIIISTIAFKDTVVATIQRAFLGDEKHDQETLDRYAQKHLQKHVDKGLKVKFFLADSEIDLLRNTFSIIHGWRPDFLGIWNIDFDMPRILKACADAGVDPRDILCDPKIPKPLRVCKYNKGITSKESAGGVSQTIPPASQWHTMDLSASFFVICMMASYRRVRLPGSELPSYSLDSILQREKLDGKITIPEAEKFKKLRWHKFMQSDRKLDYIMYAGYDSWSLILLNEKTGDLYTTLPGLASDTALTDYASQSRRQRDSTYLFGLKKGLILGTPGPVPKKDNNKIVKKWSRDEDGDFDEGDIVEGEGDDPTTLGTRGWTITLRAYMSEPGLCLIEEDSTLTTLIRTHNYDNDVISAYPNCILVANVSKHTTVFEVTGFKRGGIPIPQSVYRMQNLNFVLGVTNHVEYAQEMAGAPLYAELASMMEEDLLNETK